jgi:hypothetical protein
MNTVLTVTFLLVCNLVSYCEGNEVGTIETDMLKRIFVIRRDGATAEQGN